jgi:hypothetical protein
VRQGVAAPGKMFTPQLAESISQATDVRGRCTINLNRCKQIVLALLTKTTANITEAHVESILEISDPRCYSVQTLLPPRLTKRTNSMKHSSSEKMIVL